MADEIIRELWAIKDEIARENNYDVDALIECLMKRATDPARNSVNLSASKTCDPSVQTLSRDN